MIPMRDTMRIVLLGKTGSGKSSLANTIIRDNFFKVSHSPNSGTDKCEAETRKVNGHDIQIVDTPGLFDTDPSKSKVSPELLKCIVECAPGPHAFLLVLKMEKYTEHEMEVVKIIRKCFTDEALKYTTVVFTRGDDLPDGMRIEEWVEQNKSLHELVQECGGRCHVFDNKYWKNSEDEYRNNQYQITELLKTINKTVEDNGGKYYTNEMLKKTGELIQEEKTRLRTTLSADLSDEEVHKMAKKNIFKRLWSRIKDNKAGILLGALLGVGAMVALVVSAIPITAVAVVISVASGTTGAVAGAAVGGVIQYGLKKIICKQADENQGVDEQPLLRQEEETEIEEEAETEAQEENLSPELQAKREEAEEKLREWHHMYQDYKKNK